MTTSGLCHGRRHSLQHLRWQPFDSVRNADPSCALKVPFWPHKQHTLRTCLLLFVQVVLTSANQPNSTATTTINGSFEFTTNPSLLVNATLLIPNNQTASRGVLLANGTSYICADTATNQALPFTMSAQVPSNGMTIKRRLHTATC